jgi:transcriptional regulator with XRE-family HTH domain
MASNPLAQHLDQLRRDRGLSVRALARLAGRNHVHVGDVLRGESSPGIDVLYDLAGALGDTDLASALRPYIASDAA